MCREIWITDGRNGENTIELDCPKLLKNYFGWTNEDLVICEGYFPINDESCLCQIDIDETLKKHKISFKLDSDPFIYLVKKLNIKRKNPILWKQIQNK